jgi:hypothetical protein
MKKSIVNVTVRLVVQVDDGCPELNKEELENVLEDMDYQFKEADHHGKTGVHINPDETEITDWEIL